MSWPVLMDVKKQQIYLHIYFSCCSCNEKFFDQHAKWPELRICQYTIAVTSYAQCILATWVFLNLKQTSFETRKNGFYFTSKACFVLEIFEFKNFDISNFMTSSNAWVWNKKYISCNFTIEKFLSKKLYKRWGLVLRPFHFLRFLWKKNLKKSACEFWHILTVLLFTNSI